jgi:hypothetical protein
MEIDGLQDAIARANRKVARLPKTDHTAGELSGAIVELVESYSGRLSLAAAVGALDIAKWSLLDGQIGDS